MCFALGCSSAEEFIDSDEPQTEMFSEQAEVKLPNEEIVVEIDSAVAAQTDLEEQNLAIAENVLKMKFQREANNLTHLYVTAQQLFFNGNSEQALILIQQANQIRENADIKALKGSIYYSLGYRGKFEENWRKALELDPSVPIPSIPVIERELQLLGLID